MARIRSIHQGFFTDERLVSISAFARLLLIGIWTEADDQGIFEWKPITLKMKLFPVDNIEIPALLDELVGADAIHRFSASSREFGAIRNFRKFQRPKSPNGIHPRPDDWGNYVGLSQSISEIDDHKDRDVYSSGAVKAASFPPKEEKHFQMEEGGGRVEDKKEPEAPKAPNNLAKLPDPDADLFRRGKEILGDSAGGQIRKLKTLFGGDVAKTREFLEIAGAKDDPKEYVGGALRRHTGKNSTPFDNHTWAQTA